jgi:hypothetical protein
MYVCINISPWQHHIFSDLPLPCLVFGEGVRTYQRGFCKTVFGI